MTFFPEFDMQVAGKVTRGLVALAVVCVAAPLSAQGKPAAKPAAGAASSGKVAFVNAQRILQSTPGWTTAEQTFAKESEGYRTELQRLQATLDSLATDFEQQSVVLSPSQRQAKRQELEQKRTQLEQRAQELQQKAGARQRELLEPLQTKVNGVIETVRAEGGYAMIFDASAPGSAIVAADRSLDLTDRVIERLKGSN
ncbi:MAG: OmpH family outer membrane protein [Gemmatimonadales bacterium]|nr:OmpH family outer membrane protein [Gemmatimonadales bacterium]